MLLNQRGERVRLSRRFWSFFVVAACAWITATGCGARGEPIDGIFGEPVEPGSVPSLTDAGPRRCTGDLDCASGDACRPRQCENGVCVDLEPVRCDDGDPCTNDRCLPATGECEFSPVSFDRDGDGFRGPRPGFAPGAAGACGEDCDDTRASALPGGIERCDGVDNDCNGVVDDRAAYLPAGTAPVLVSQDARESSVGGLVFGNRFYGATYTSQRDRWSSVIEGLGRDGSTVVPPRSFTGVNNDNFSGSIVYTGKQFGVAWEDRRDADFEIYFNRFDEEGNKLGPDVRVTEAPDFSLGPEVLYDGGQFLLVWADRRNGRGDYRIYGQRIGAGGKLDGPNLELTESGLDAEDPSLARGIENLGLTFNFDGLDGARRVGFVLLEPDLSVASDLVSLGSRHAVAASVVFSGDRYIVAWQTRDGAPGRTIRGAAVGLDGTVLVDDAALTEEAPFARSHSLLSLGDRLLLIWAEERNGSYDLYSKMLSLDFSTLTEKRRITRSPADALNPVAAFGPEGDVGILYEDHRGGAAQVYFTRLSCLSGN